MSIEQELIGHTITILLEPDLERTGVLEGIYDRYLSLEDETGRRFLLPRKRIIEIHINPEQPVEKTRIFAVPTPLAVSAGQKETLPISQSDVDFYQPGRGGILPSEIIKKMTEQQQGDDADPRVSLPEEQAKYSIDFGLDFSQPGTTENGINFALENEDGSEKEA